MTSKILTYDPYGYVPGGATKAVAKAIQRKARIAPVPPAVRPAVSRATPAAAPVPPSLDEQAGTQAQNAIDAQTAAINSALAGYAASMERRRQAYVQLSQAAAHELERLGPEMQAGYERAASELGSLGAPLSEGVRARLAAEQGANADYVRSQVAGADTPHVPNVQAVKDALYMSGAVIPSENLTAEGLAGLEYGLRQPSIALGEGAAQLRSLDAEIDAKEAEYRQQLIDTAAKYPELRDQAFAALQKSKLDAEAAKLEARKVALQERAQTDIETRLGLTKDTAALNAKKVRAEIANMAADNALARKKADAAIAAAQAKGQQPNASLSRIYGYVATSDGTPILDANGKRIPVNSSSSGAGKKQSAISSATSTARQIAEHAAQQVAGAADPVTGKATPKPRYSYNAALAQVEAAIEPILSAYMTPSEIIAFARKAVAPYYPNHA
jgi:hypothetical protein